ncbi:MAG TPA: beta-ketoacyl-ACP synthase III [Hyphomonadaceae bacterium]|nr:beta-ketoacyl-ACP synthase III [Hyphomonadaceae bacterium]
MTEYASVVRGVAGHLPEKVLTNDDLARMVDTTDEWISARTGIRKRHIAADGETTSDLGAAAARKALEAAGVKPDEIDLIIVATATPDYTFPATATVVQNKLGITSGAAFDVQAVCSGFVYAMATADNFLARGQFERALVIGAETFSRILDWSDRSTCVLFGDGAGAVVLERQEKSKAGDRGVKGIHLRSDGRYKDLLYVDGGPSTTQTVGHLRMVGNQVFKHAVSKISDSVKAAAQQAGIAVQDIDWFVPHQANQRILSAVAERLGLDEHKVVSTVAEHGNTSAASVPLALASATEDGRIKAGDLVLIEAIGGGLTWGSALLRV